MNKLDWYLNQFGVTQYELRKKTVNTITQNSRLIIIVNSDYNEKIFYDILKAIHVTIEECTILAQDQLNLPIEQLDHVIWFIDCNLPDEWQNSPQIENKAIIKTESLTTLAKSPILKRQLWKQLCQYESYLSA